MIGLLITITVPHKKETASVEMRDELQDPDRDVTTTAVHSQRGGERLEGDTTNNGKARGSREKPSQVAPDRAAGAHLVERPAWCSSFRDR